MVSIIENNTPFVPELYHDFCHGQTESRCMAPNDFKATCKLAVFHLRGRDNINDAYIKERMRMCLLDLALLNDLSEAEQRATKAYVNARGDSYEEIDRLEREEFLELLPDIIRKHDIEGMTFTEIGDELGITRQTARKQYAQALIEARDSQDLRDYYERQ